MQLNRTIEFLRTFIQRCDDLHIFTIAKPSDEGKEKEQEENQQKGSEAQKFLNNAIIFQLLLLRLSIACLQSNNSSISDFSDNESSIVTKYLSSFCVERSLNPLITSTLINALTPCLNEIINNNNNNNENYTMSIGKIFSCLQLNLVGLSSHIEIPQQEELSLSFPSNTRSPFLKRISAAFSPNLLSEPSIAPALKSQTVKALDVVSNVLDMIFFLSILLKYDWNYVTPSSRLRITFRNGSNSTKIITSSKHESSII
jgi:hypothetical protein